MPSDPLTELTRLQEQEERAVGLMEEHQRQLATLEALREEAERRGEAPDVIEAQIKAAEDGIARAEREAAALRERIAAAERALPAALRDEDGEA